MKNKNIVKLLIPIFMVIILVFLMFFKLFTSYSFGLYLNWGIKIPFGIDYSIIYDKDSGESFHGDGIFYNVLSYENEKNISDFLKWTKKEHSTIYNSSMKEASNSLFDEIKVDNNIRPNYDNCLSYYKTQDDNNELLIFWDKIGKKLYILENCL